MNSESESYDSDDSYREARDRSESENSNASQLSAGSDFFEAFVQWVEMAERPQVQLDNASIDRLASSLVSSNNFRLRSFTGTRPVAEGGGTEDVHRWIEDYEDLCAVNGWDDATKCQKLPGFLSAGARDYFREEIRGNNAANNWGQLKTALLDFYKPIDHTTKAMEMLCNRTQRPMEPVQAYILEMKRLAKIADANLPADQLKFWVLKGIHPQIRACLKRRDIPDMAILMSEARKIESSLSDDDPLGAQAPLAATLLEPVHDALSSLSQRFEKIATMVESRPVAPQNEDKDKRLCHYCGFPGHLKLACRKRINDEQRKQRNGNGNRQASQGQPRRDSEQNRDSHRYRSQERSEPRDRNNGRYPSQERYATRYDRDNDQRRSRDRYDSRSSDRFRDFSRERRDDRWRERQNSSDRNRSLSSDRDNGGRRSSTPYRSWQQSMMLQEEVNALKEHPEVQVKVDGREHRALVDSGATSTFIHYDVFKFLPPEAQELEPYHGAVTTADRSTLTGILGKVNINISLTLDGVTKEIPIDAIVCKHIAYPLILGIRFMSAADLVIHPRMRKVYFCTNERKDCFGNKVRFADEIILFASEDVLLPPRCKTQLPVIAPAAGTDDIILMEPEQSLYASHRLATPRAVVNGRSETMIEVINLSESERTVRKGQVIGRGERINSDAIIPADGLGRGNENTDRLMVMDDSRIQKSKTKSVLQDLKLNNGQVRVGSNLTHDQKIELRDFLERNSDIMAFDPKQLGKCTLFKHRIELEDTKPLSCTPSRKSAKHRELESKMVDSYLEEGVIRPSCSPWASRTVIVPKKGGDLRFCVDYRRLNKVTKRDVYPLMNIEDAMASLAGSKLFTSLDLNKGYWQIEVEEEDKEKTAFVTQDGLYEFNRMPFGLSNAPATFQRTMDVILSGLKWNQCLVYLDDVLIFAPSFHEMINRMERVFSRIRQADMTINPKKCIFACESILYLGHIITPEGSFPDPDKVKAIAAMRRPERVEELKSFEAMCSYYRTYIFDYSEIVAPLLQLTRSYQKGTALVSLWKREHESAFNQLKDALTSSPVLVHYDPSLPIEVRTDASGAGLGAVLLQEHDVVGKKRKQLRPVAFASRLIRDSEIPYTITEKEALAIVFALDRFRVYLEGKQFVVVTDHCALCYLRTKEKLPPRLMRWAILMSEFDFSIKHKPGTHHRDVDCLSRSVPMELPLSEEEGMRTTFAFLSLEAMDEIRNEQDADPKISPIKHLLETGKLAVNFELDNGLVYNTSTGRRRLYVPATLRDDFLYTYHTDILTGGHFGEKKTIDKINARVYWPNMTESVKEFIRTCEDCLKNKVPRLKPAGLLHPLPVSRPFQMIGIDTVGTFPTSHGNNYILVATDYFTKWAETRAVPANTAKAVADFIREQIICRHGFPEVIVTDRGTNYTSNMIKELLSSMDCQHAKTSAYHPQSNGLCERINGVLVASLKNYVNEQHNNWSGLLPLVTFAYNCSKSASTKYTPFFLVHKEDPVFPADMNVNTIPVGFSGYRDFVDKMKKLWPEIRENVLRSIQQAQDAQKKDYDKHRRQVIFHPGDKVMLYRPVRKVGKSEKLLQRFFGPYTVVERLLDNCYKLKVDRHFETAHVSRLKPWYERTSLSQINESEETNEEPQVATMTTEGGSPRPIIEITSFTQPLTALLDTGANASFMSHDAWTKIESLMGVETSLRTGTVRVTTSDGSMHQGITGWYPIDITVALEGWVKHFEINVYVARRLSFPVILGVDFLKNAKVIMNLGSGRIFYEGHENTTSSEPRNRDTDLLPNVCSSCGERDRNDDNQERSSSHPSEDIWTDGFTRNDWETVSNYSCNYMNVETKEPNNGNLSVKETKQSTKSPALRKNKSSWIWNLILFAILWGLLPQTSAQFEGGASVIWRPTKHDLIRGEETVTFVEVYTSPCEIYEKHLTLHKDDKKQFMEWCDAHFETLFLKVMRGTCATDVLIRQKRVVPVIAAVLGAAALVAVGITAISLGSVAIHKVNKLEERLDGTDRRVHSLQQKQHMLQQALQSMDGELTELRGSFNNLTNRYAPFLAALPSLMMATADVSARLHSYNSRLIQIMRAYEHGKVDADFFDLHNLTLPCQKPGECPSHLSQSQGCIMDETDKTITFTFRMIMIERHEMLVEASPFLIRILKPKNQICLKTYTGPKQLILNTDTEKVCSIQQMPVDSRDLILKRKTGVCNTNVTAIENWSEKCYPRLEAPEPHFQAKLRSREFLHVFCYGLTITIFGREQSCPAYVFVLHSNVSFECDGRHYQADARSIEKTEMLLPYWQTKINTHMMANPYYVPHYERQMDFPEDTVFDGHLLSIGLTMIMTLTAAGAAIAATYFYCLKGKEVRPKTRAKVVFKRAKSESDASEFETADTDAVPKPAPKPKRRDPLSLTGITIMN